MSVKVTIKDKGLVDLRKRLADLQGISVTVGLQGDSGGKMHPLATVNIATVGLMTEFGTIDAPARPWLRTAIIDNKDKIAKAFAREYAKLVAGNATAVDASAEVGKVMAELVRERIEKANAWAVPNAVSTIEKKGHSDVLRGGDPKKNIPPGTMLEAVTYEVRRGGSVLARGK